MLKFTFKRLVWLILIVAVLIGVYRLGQSKPEPINPNAASEKEVKELVQKVGKFMDLPDELPGIANVVDKSKISNEPFFAKAQDGDKLLVFVQSRKIILYRPSTNKVIESTTLFLKP